MFSSWKGQESVKVIIDEYSDDNDIPNKIKAAGVLWKTIPEEEKQEWTQKSIDYFNANNKAENVNTD